MPVVALFALLAAQAVETVPPVDVSSVDAPPPVQAPMPVDAAPPAPVAPSTLRVLVLAPRGDQVDASARAAVASLVAAELQKLDGVDVVSAADVANVAALEAEKQAIGCDDTGACLAEIAGALGARFVVFGDAAPLGDEFVVNLSLFDSQESRSVGRASVQVASLDRLPRRVPAAARALVADAPAFAGKAFPDEGPSPAFVGGLVVAGAGALVGTLGVAFDLVSPTSVNAVVDPLDFVGPAAIAVGVAAVAGGAAFALWGDDL